MKPVHGAGAVLQGHALTGVACFVVSAAGRCAAADAPVRLTEALMAGDCRQCESCLPQIFTSTVGSPLQRVPSDFLDSLPSIEEELQRITRASIWVVHTPPLGGGLDTVGGDDAAGIRRGEHVGSKAVSQAIERLQPILTLHGHIHEAPAVSGRWIERIGETVAVNPGQGRQLHAAVADVGADGCLLRIRHTVLGEADLAHL